MKVLVVNVRLSELHTQQLNVGAWEVPIIEAVHGSGDVEVVGEIEIDRPYPDAADEFARLLQRYKGDPEVGGAPYVAQVYGQHGAGVANLARRIANEEADSGMEKAELTPESTQEGQPGGETEESGRKPRTKATG